MSLIAILYTDEQVTSQERVFRLLPEEIPAFNLNFSVEKRTFEDQLKVLRGQLRYLTGLQVVQSLQREGSRDLIGQKQRVVYKTFRDISSGSHAQKANLGTTDKSVITQRI